MQYCGLHHIQASLSTIITCYSIINRKDLGRFWICHRVCVYCHGFHNRRSCLSHLTVSMSLWLYFRTMCCSKGQIKTHWGPHKPEGGAVGWRRLKSDIPEVTHDISNTQGSRQSRTDRGTKACGFVHKCMKTLSGEERNDLRLKVESLLDLVPVHLWAPWKKSRPTRNWPRKPVRWTRTTTRFELFFFFYLSFSTLCTNSVIPGNMLWTIMRIWQEEFLWPCQVLQWTEANRRLTNTCSQPFWRTQILDEHLITFLCAETVTLFS